MSIIGERIKVLRNDYDLTITDMAKRIGVSRSAVSRYESGEMNPTLDVMVKIREVFNVSMDWLMGFEREEDYKFNALIEVCKQNNVSADKLNHLLHYLDAYNDKLNDKK